MTLQDFITESLKSIINGVSDSKKFAEANGAIINPTKDFESVKKDSTWIWRGNGQDGIRPVTKIDFDIAIIVGNEENNSINGGLNIQIFKASGQARNSETNQTTSRISFSLDVALPETYITS